MQRGADGARVPTWSKRCTAPSSRRAWTWSRPTPSALSAWCSPSTGSPSAPHELNVAAATIARRAADAFSTPERPRFVAGNLGPGTKFPSLGQIRYDDLRDAYTEQAAGLLEGGVDLLVVETVYDLLQAKAALNACKRAMVAAGRRVPLQVQVTIELTGRMLPGTEIGAALCALDPMRPDIIGLNCATGPAEMGEAVRHLTTAQPDARLRPTERRSALGRRRRDALRPHPRRSSPTISSASSPSTA